MQTNSRDKSDSCSTCPKWLHIKEFGLSHKNPKRFVTLEIGRPIFYLPWTIFWTVYHGVWIILEAYWWSLKSHRAPMEWLLKLTNLGYVALSAVAIVECMIAVYTYCFLTEKEREIQMNLPWYSRLSWILHNISHPTALLIALSYWTMIFPHHTVKAWTINKHAINLLYTFLLLIMTPKPVKFQHVYIPMIFSFVYLLFTWIYFLVTDEIIYSFLQWDKPGKAIKLTILYVFVCTPLAHFAICGIYKLKQFVKGKCRPTKCKTVEICEKKDEDSKEEMLSNTNNSGVENV